MKYIIVDDKKEFAEKLRGSLQGESKFTSSENSELNTLAGVIKEKINGNDDTVLFINVNLKTDKNTRQLQKGIELLIWLRIKEVLNHVVLFSFETLHSLLNRNPKHLIATSWGTSFVQLPNDFKQLQEVLSKKKEEEKIFLADAENVRKTLKPAFSIAQFRHREANWWGVKQLWDVHRIMVNKHDAKYPTVIKEKLRLLNNSIAKYIYEYSLETIQKTIADGEAIRRDKCNELEKKIEELTMNLLPLIEKVENNASEINQKEKEIEQLSETYLRFNDVNISQQIRLLKEDLFFFNEVAALEEAEKNIVVFEREKSLSAIASLKHQLENVKEILKEKCNAFANDYAEWVVQINSKSVSILYIDDNAGNGWSFVLKQVFPKASISCIIPDIKLKGEIEKFYTTQIQPAISNCKPNVILLDLRLFDEDEDSIEVDKLSGTHILRQIKNSYPGIPVIITTASNKLWSFKQLISLGAEGYWTKEGLDERRNTQNSIKNYYSLIQLIAKASSKKYLTLKKLIDYDLLLTATQSPWWTTGFWKNNDPKNGNTTEIKNIVDSSIKMLGMYLHEFHMAETNKTVHEEKFFISSLIMRLCSVYEFVHNIDRDAFQALTSSKKGGVSGFMENERGDGSFIKLKKLRNKAAHTEFWSLNWNSLELAVNETIKYLNFPNTP